MTLNLAETSVVKSRPPVPCWANFYNVVVVLVVVVM